MIKLFSTKIDLNFPDDSFQNLLTYLSDDVRTRILYFYQPEDKLRCFFGKLLLCSILYREYHLPCFPSLLYDQNKRPYQNLIPQLDFNLSHSGEWIICGINDRGNIGVDIEKIGFQAKTEIADRCFSQEETALLSRLPSAMKTPAFYHLWTLKEAYIKAEGSTFKIPLDAFSFDISNPEHPKCVFSNDFKHSTSCRFRSFKINGEYIISICAFGNDKAENNIPDIIEISIPELLKVLKKLKNDG